MAFKGQKKGMKSADGTNVHLMYTVLQMFWQFGLFMM